MGFVPNAFEPESILTLCILSKIEKLEQNIYILLWNPGVLVCCLFLVFFICIAGCLWTFQSKLELHPCKQCVYLLTDSLYPEHEADKE